MKCTALVALAALSLIGCGGPESPGSPQTQALTCKASASGSVMVENAWVRAQSDPTAMSAAYFHLCNGTTSPVTVNGLETPAARIVELHETTRDARGVVSMAPTGPITLAPGEAVVFAPGGKHAMLMGLPAPIEENSTTTISIQIEGGAAISAEAKVMSAADAAAHTH
ncbi:MAG: copper chaperone PCu(A)C [Parvularculaceae bacterium]|nr:copper chaperone PCu(A)C [Parvularculaceae bacterium]